MARKEKIIRVRLTQEQRDVLQKAATNSGLDFSSWLRDRSLKAARNELSESNSPNLKEPAHWNDRVTNSPTGQGDTTSDSGKQLSNVIFGTKQGMITIHPSNPLIPDQDKSGSFSGFPEIVSQSRAMQVVLEKVRRLLDVDLPVLITGETGTGKELIARVLHAYGKRKNEPFVAINCSALTETLLEAELFGHQKGAFTGAFSSRRGLLEEAAAGTIFLDEIADMSPAMQSKILRVLQEKEFRRVGGTETLHIQARIVLASNRDLSEMIAQKEFRVDLFYRINGVEIHLPPLRNRNEDIPLLAEYFRRWAVASLDRPVQGFTHETLDMLKRHDWPGNIRELRNEIERVVATTENVWILPNDFDFSSRTQRQIEIDNKASLHEIEKEIIRNRLSEHNWKIHEAAKSLGISRQGLYAKLKRFHLKPSQE